MINTTKTINEVKPVVAKEPVVKAVSKPVVRRVSEPAVKEVSKKELSFETKEPVSFMINGEKFEGKKFSFENKEIAEDRKQMLIRSYGPDIII